MKLIEFNFNHIVRVQLTDHGRKIHRDNWNELAKRCSAIREMGYTPPKENEDGWSSWQLWVLCKEFGPHTSMSGPLSFQIKIQIEVDDETH